MGEKSKNSQKTRNKRKFKIPKKIVMQNAKRKVWIKFHDPRVIGCRDMTAEKFDGWKSKKAKKTKKKEIQKSEKNSYAKCHKEGVYQFSWP